ncbi:hypothetical protein NADFUDRAFT_57597 [Nadsonia fulvescens var. elongata DSM 6958]|uniref:Phosphatidylserine decarboxylase proenzyme 2 n=1 Tax=Nadsonia fulvescens var. elongata DSM 6958 TaxID=857566 RepID=A0A1E3PN02_9ASCO|nr:hypothetical protein NADFUDRAFT_57597 [Nadsonia fulvescens var. elongata DSM 6958]
MKFLRKNRASYPLTKSETLPDEETLAKNKDNVQLVLRISVIKARNLAAMDRNGLSDPYAVVYGNRFRVTTQTINRSLNPEWNAEIDIPIDPLLKCPSIRIVVWDKDRWGKDYLGEVVISMYDLFLNGHFANKDPENLSSWYDLYSKKKKKDYVKGDILLKFSLVDLCNPEDTALLPKKWAKLLSFLKQSDNDIGNMYYDSVDENEEEEEEDEEEGELRSRRRLKKAEKREVRLNKKADKERSKQSHYELSSNNSVTGIVFFEVLNVTDLPPEKNFARTGFDMDPFVVISFGKRTFRTQYKRHTLNPVYNEKLVFPVLKHEKNYSINITIIDKDRFSLHDFVADAIFPVTEILKNAKQPDPETGLYQWKHLSSSSSPHSSFELSKKRKDSGKKRTSSTTHLSKPGLEIPNSDSTSSDGLQSQVDNTQLNSFQHSVNELRKNYEDLLSLEDEPSEFNIPLNLKNKSKWEDKHKPVIKLKALFLPYQALRQQFWRSLINGYDVDETGTISFIELTALLDSLGSTLSIKTVSSFFKRFGKTEEEDLTIDEVIINLENQILKDTRRDSMSRTENRQIFRENIDFASQPSRRNSPVAVDILRNQGQDNKVSNTKLLPTESDNVIPPDKSFTLSGSVSDDEPERVIRISTCPVCNQPRLRKKAELDIITHLATCLSQDWSQVSRLMMHRYVSSDQARRRWYSKVVSKVTYGNYKLGANSANILVQDRVTGLIQEEKMSVYVRLGIRLLYKGLKSKDMERRKIKKLLKSLSIKQGKKYDSPASIRDISPFINFHRLNLNEVLEPLENFKTFNEFFFRKLKPDARILEAPHESRIAVSPADCRATVFNSISRATDIWVKGRDFTINRLFGDAYPDLVDKFVGGEMGIFRLAPQDYHRFHVPVDGIVGAPKTIEGEYYTVNPMAIRSTLDVYGENVRVLVPIFSETFGVVMVVCVGAMMVGSTVITAKEGDHVKRMDELGYFQFGGSTILLLFQKDALFFDKDLVSNSKEAIETLVRVGMSIGHSPSVDEFERDQLTSDELRQKAKVIITGADEDLSSDSSLDENTDINKEVVY